MPELAARLEAARGYYGSPGLAVAVSDCSRLQRQKTLLASEAGRSDVVLDRQTWRNNRQPRMREEPDRLVFIDEIATTTK